MREQSADVVFIQQLLASASKQALNSVTVALQVKKNGLRWGSLHSAPYNASGVGTAPELIASEPQVFPSRLRAAEAHSSSRSAVLSDASVPGVASPLPLSPT